MQKDEDVCSVAESAQESPDRSLCCLGASDGLTECLHGDQPEYLWYK